MKIAILVLFIVMALSGCGTTNNIVKINDSYIHHADAKIAIGNISNETGQSFDIDIEKLLKDALINQLSKNNLLGGFSSGPNIAINTNILEYKKGDAFKRWLMPGYGSTVLAIESEIVDSEGNIIGSIQSRRTVDAGGGYTIGAWNKIFIEVAENIVKELLIKIEAQTKA